MSQLSAITKIIPDKIDSLDCIEIYKDIVGLLDCYKYGC